MTVPADALELRAMTPDDLPDVLALAHEQGRNVHREEYARFLGLEGAHGFVLARDGRLHGAITAIRYFENAFLGPALVPHGADGLAIALMAHAIEGLQRGGPCLIDAEAAEESAILARMGFAPTRTTLVLERAPASGEAAPTRTERLTPADFLDLGVLDAAVFGHGRKEFLYALMQDHPEGARVVRRDGDVAGYAFLRRSRRGYHLGPLVTKEGAQDVARDLLADALALSAGWPVVTLAPEGSPLLLDLEKAGFEVVASLRRMRAGTPGRESDEFPPARATEWLVGSRLTG